MTIVLVNSLYTPNLFGGAERSVQSLAEALAQQGHDVWVISTHGQKNLEKKLINGVNVLYLGLRNLYWPQSGKEKKWQKPLWHLMDSSNDLMADKVMKQILKISPDVVHTNNLAGVSVALWKKLKSANIPILHTLRDYYLLCPRTTLFRKNQNCNKRCLDCLSYSHIKKKQTKHVDTVIGISQYILKRHLQEGYFKEAKTRVIGNSYEKPNLLSHAKTKIGKVGIGFLGRIEPTKGVEKLLDSCSKLPLEKYELYLGGRAKESYLNALKTRYDNVNAFYEGQINPKILFDKIDVLVVPSLWQEPFGRVVIEAFAHGIPVIASKQGGLTELVTPKETGFIFDPNEHNSLSEILQNVLRSPKQLTNMATNCLRKAQEYEPQAILEKYMSLYKAVIK